MKNYKVKAIVNFPDKTTHQRRTLGEEFVCTEERYNELKYKMNLDANIDAIVEEIVEEIVEKKPRKRKTSKK